MKKYRSREKAVEDGRSVEKKQCGQEKVPGLSRLSVTRKVMTKEGLRDY